MKDKYIFDINTSVYRNSLIETLGADFEYSDSAFLRLDPHHLRRDDIKFQTNNLDGDVMEQLESTEVRFPSTLDPQWLLLHYD